MTRLGRVLQIHKLAQIFTNRFVGISVDWQGSSDLHAKGQETFIIPKETFDLPPNTRLKVFA